MKNIYRVTVEDLGLRFSQKMVAESAAEVRKDIETSLPGVKIVNIELVG